MAATISPQQLRQGCEERGCENESAKRHPLQGLKSERICFLCKKEFTKPKLLPCFHTFCADCLTHFVRTMPSSPRNSFQCPLCTMKIDLESGSMLELEDNKYFEFFDMETSNRSICDSCKKRKPICQCDECSQSYCLSCKRAHQNMASSRNHRMIDIVQTKIHYCEKHENEELNLYCEDCKKCICGTCNFTTHKMHTCDDIKTPAQRAKHRLMQQLASFEESIPNFQNLMLAREERKVALNEDTEAKRDELVKRVEKFKCTLEKSLDKSLQVLQTFKERAEDELEDERQSLERMMNSSTSLKEFTKCFLEVASVTDLVSNCELLLASLQSCADQVNKLKDGPSYFLDDSWDSSPEEDRCKSTLGQITLFRRPRTYSTKEQCVYRIPKLCSYHNVLCPISEDACWIMDCGSDKLFRFDKRDASTNLYKSFNHDRYQFHPVLSSNSNEGGQTCLATAQVTGVVTTSLKWVIRKIDRSGKISKMFTVAETNCFIHCLCVAGNGELVVMSSKSPIEGYRLIHFSENGNAIKTVNVKALSICTAFPRNPKFIFFNGVYNVCFLYDKFFCLSTSNHALVTVDTADSCSKVKVKFQGEVMCHDGKHMFILDGERMQKFLYDGSEDPTDIPSSSMNLKQPSGSYRYSMAVDKSGDLWLLNCSKQLVSIIHTSEDQYNI